MFSSAGHRALKDMKPLRQCAKTKHFAKNLRSVIRRIRIVAKIAYYLRHVRPLIRMSGYFNVAPHWTDFSHILGGERV